MRLKYVEAHKKGFVAEYSDHWTRFPVNPDPSVQCQHGMIPLATFFYGCMYFNMNWTIWVPAESKPVEKSC